MMVRRGAAAADHTKATRRGGCEHGADRFEMGEAGSAQRAAEGEGSAESADWLFGSVIFGIIFSPQAPRCGET